MAQIVLTPEEKIKAFKDSLDNLYSSGWFEGYGLEWDYDDAAYKAARAKLTDPCVEDVLLQILQDGGEIKVNDIEGDGDQNGTITLQKIYDNIDTTPFRHMSDHLEENDDITTADVIIQCILYREVVFG